MFSILIPTYNNLEYLKLCLYSIKKNSNYSHEIILHINDGSDGTIKYANENNLKFTSSNKNIGLCSSINKASTIANYNYLLYAHDDMYFCPDWDVPLLKELKNINHDIIKAGIIRYFVDILFLLKNCVIISIIQPLLYTQL